MRCDDQRRFPNGNGHPTRRRAAFGAVFGLLLATLLGVPSCLNPRPEEEPSVVVGPGPVGAADEDRPLVERPRETCEDNSLLAGCEAPSVDAPADSPDNAPGSAPVPSGAQAEPDPASPPDDAEAPGAGDAGAADAGASAPGSAVVD